MMGPGMVFPGMLRMMLILMDTDNDGALSLTEFQAVPERMFKALDANKDGRLTMEELQAWIRGPGETTRQGGTPRESKPAQ